MHMMQRRNGEAFRHCSQNKTPGEKVSSAIANQELSLLVADRRKKARCRHCSNFAMSSCTVHQIQAVNKGCKSMR